jgi:hypothetical protein
MRSSSGPPLRWTLLLALGLSVEAAAQQERRSAPDQHQAYTYVSVRARTADIPSLDRPMAVDLNRTPLRLALEQIAAQAGLRLTYSTDLLPSDVRVSLHETAITGTDAVLRVLEGTSLDVLVGPSGHAVLVECSLSTCGPRAKGSQPKLAQRPPS